MRNIVNKSNWEILRGLSGLSIFTLVSGYTILIVPILLWVFKAGYSARNVVINTEDNESNNYSQYLIDVIITSDAKLPSTLKYAFTAAVCLILGKVVYEIFCKKLVKEYSMGEYKKKAFDEKPLTEHHQNKKIDDSFYYIKKAGKLFSDKHLEFIPHANNYIWIDDSIEKTKKYYHKPKKKEDFSTTNIDEKKSPQPPYTFEQLQPIIIETGAEAEYVIEARSNKLSFTISLFFYLAALLFTFLIIVCHGYKIWHDYDKVLPGFLKCLC